MANYIKSPTQALAYSRFRPYPPQQLTDSILSFLKKEPTTKEPLELALDIGCGSGQGTSSLAPHFKRVVGVDSSREQLEHAVENNTHSNVTYRLGPAERLQEVSGSVDLVTVGMAVHWFDLPRFFEEVGRVLRVGGALAIYGHGLPRPSSAHGDLADSVQSIIKSTLGQFIPNESRLVYFEEYKGHQFGKCPFSKSPAVRLGFESRSENAAVGDFVGYISTTSGYQNFKIRHGEENGLAFLKQLEAMIVEKIGKRGAGHTTLDIIFHYFLLLSRKDL